MTFKFSFADKKEDQIPVRDRWRRILLEPASGRTNGPSRRKRAARFDLRKHSATRWRHGRVHGRAHAQHPADHCVWLPLAPRASPPHQQRRTSRPNIVQLRKVRQRRSHLRPEPRWRRGRRSTPSWRPDPIFVAALSPIPEFVSRNSRRVMLRITDLFKRLFKCCNTPRSKKRIFILMF